MSTASFRLAPTSTGMRVLTGVSWLVPLIRPRRRARRTGPDARHAAGRGVGGLWGGFGLLRMRGTTFSMWISRRLVIVELRGGRPLLLTPEMPDRFVAALAV